MHRNPQSSYFSFLFRTVLSILVLVMPSCPVWAADSLSRRSSTSTTTTTTSGSGTSGTIPTTEGGAKARDSLSRASLAISAVAAMQKNINTNLRNQPTPLGGYVIRNTNGNPLKDTNGIPLTFTDGLANPKNENDTAGLRQASGSDSLWVGADNPSVGTNPNDIIITQTKPQAFLQWDTFNIGKNTTIAFDQLTKGGADVNNWIAFNYVRDKSANPSQILGTIKADGQVYILNANGILFGGTAQVNTHALVASALPINPTLLNRGLLVQNAKDVQFLFDSVKTSSYDPGLATDYSPAQTPGVGGTGTTYGEITVQPGAVLKAYDDEANHIGGRIALIGRNVTNGGKIETNDGQTILAAGLQVALVAHNSADPTLRGLDAYVGQVGTDSNSGKAENWGVTDSSGNLTGGGLIEAHRGSVYITGKTVNQNGVIDSSTSVSYNGRIDLVAGYNAVANNDSAYGYDPASTKTTGLSIQQFYYPSSTASAPNSGAVNLGINSVLRILPEDSFDRVVGDLTLPSQVNIQGQSVHLNTGSILLAPGAVTPLAKAYGADGVALTAGVTIQAGSWNTVSSSQFLHTADDQQIFLEDDAIIDVAGLTNVEASVTENIISVELRGTELANSPLQKNGALRGQTVQVDLRQHGAWDSSLNGGLGGYTWVGTPLADTSGWVSLTTHTAEELMTNGGSVALTAGGAIVVQAKAKIDVSGGSIAYQGGYVDTTKVISAGHIYDISQATADRVYDGVYTGVTTTTDAKWGVTTTTVNPLARLDTYDAEYTQGGNGGSLAITGPVLALDGTLLGKTVADSRQRTLSPVYNPASPPDPAKPTAAGISNWLLTALNLPIPSQLSITVGRQWLSPIDHNPRTTSPTPANIIFSDSPQQYTIKPDDSTTPEFAKFDLVSGGAAFAKARNYELDLTPSLFSALGSGFGILTVDNSGDNVGLVPKKDGVVGYIAPDQTSGIPAFGTITLPGGGALNMSAGGALNLKSTNITVEAGSSIAAAGGSISLKAYDVSSSVVDNLASYTGTSTTPPVDAVPTYDPDRGRIILEKGSQISAAGGVAYDSTSDALVTAGGSISLIGSSLAFADGSVLDVSGGANVSASGKITYGNAGGSVNKGGITLQSGLAIGASYVFGGGLQVAGKLLNKGYAGLGKSGGSLSITAPAITILASTHQDGSLSDNSMIGADLDTGMLSVAPGFFNQGGFTKFGLTALGLVTDKNGYWHGSVPTSGYSFEVAAGAQVAPQVWNWGGIGGDKLLYVEKVLADVHLRQPVSLSFASRGLFKDYYGSILYNATGLFLGYRSLLTTDNAGGTGGAYAFAPAQISLSAGMGGTLDILGTIKAPGGTITLSQDQSDDLGLYAEFSPTIHLASSSVLDASGEALWAYDATHSVLADQTERGFIKVGVSDGGSISVDGNIVAEGVKYMKDANGNIVTDSSGKPRVEEKGATLSVSGSSDTILQTPGNAMANANLNSGAKLAAVVKDSNGGTLTLVGEQMLYTRATLEGMAGGVTAQGGDLVIASNRYNRNGNVLLQNIATVDDPMLILSSSNPDFSFNGLGKAVGLNSTFVVDTEKQLGQIVFGVNNLTSGGFDGLTFSVNGLDSSRTASGAIQVQGTVALSANRQITIANGGVLSFAANSSLMLTAPYVKLGQDFLLPAATATLNTMPTSGSGELMVHASTLIDVGTLMVKGAGTVALDATYDGTSLGSNGSIRGDGTLEVAGGITLTAGQIYPPTDLTFNIIAYDYTTTDGAKSGSVTIRASTLEHTRNLYPTLPLSAVGRLNIYATTIDQGGVLRAPFGNITLGAATTDGTFSTVTDPLSSTAKKVPVTTKLILEPGSLTSVSAVGATTALTIPYGIDVNGDTWVDPSGNDITNQGPTAKYIALTASSVEIDPKDPTKGQSAAKVDLTGGGDLLAYRFVAGVGGKNDLLLPAPLTDGSTPVTGTAVTTGAFAIVKDYSDSFSPFAPNLSTGDLGPKALGYDPGYVFNTNSKYPVYSSGACIHLAAGSGLPEGDYTILPARYAVLPGAYLVTPKGSSVTSGAAPAVTIPEGATLVSGYIYNGLNPAGQSQTLFKTYEVAPYSVVTNRAKYDLSYANSFFDAVAQKAGVVTPRLPVDAGQLVLAAQSRLILEGNIDVRLFGTGGRAGLIDIATNQDIQIGGTLDKGSTALLLDPVELNGLGSLLIGGSRQTGAKITAINVSTSNLTVAGDAQIQDSDLILVSKGSLMINDGAQLGSPVDKTFVADDLSVLGDGALVRISSDANATFTRNHVTDAGGNPIAFKTGTDAAQLIVGQTGSLKISGASVILDSSAAQTITHGLTFDGSSPKVSLSSGQISLGSPDLIPEGLFLDNSLVGQLNKSAGLSLLSYGSIDFYTSPNTPFVLGSADLRSLELHTSALRNIGGGDVMIAATNEILIDNRAGSAAPVAGDNPNGTLTLTAGFAASAGKIRLGVKQVETQDFANVNLIANGGLLIEGEDTKVGTTTVPAIFNVAGGNLTITTPVVEGGITSSKQSISADKNLLLRSGTASAKGITDLPGLAANLTLTAGNTVNIGTGTAIKLPSGTLAVQTGGTGGIAIAGSLDVGGVSKTFFDVAKPTDGGTITLTTPTGNVDVTGTLNVGHFAGDADRNASTWDGDAGTLNISAPHGTFSAIGAQLFGRVATLGQLGGNFNLDVGSLPNAGSLAALHALLNGSDSKTGASLLAGGFNHSISIRVRTGDVVVDGSMQANNYSLSADSGRIEVTGTINAASPMVGTDTTKLPAQVSTDNLTGGTIGLAASGSVTLNPGSLLDARGYCYDNAGKGGAISLSAGEYVNGSVDKNARVVFSPAESGAFERRIDLGVANNFTIEDLVIAAGNQTIPSSSTRADLATNGGTLHLRESQAAFDDGSGFSGYSRYVKGYSSIVLEGFMVYDLSGKSATPYTQTPTTNSDNTITSIGSGGLINLAVQDVVKNNGVAFASKIKLVTSEQEHIDIEPGAEIINTGIDPITGAASTSVSELVTLNAVNTNTGTSATVSAGASQAKFNLNKNSSFTVALPGGIPVGQKLKSSAAGTVYYADGSHASFSVNALIAPTSSTTGLRAVAVVFTTTTATASPVLTFTGASSSITGATPVLLAFDPHSTALSVNNPVVPTNAATATTKVGDLVLAGTWDLGAHNTATDYYTYRFGANNNEPGVLTLRARNNLVFAFDASLSDGFDAAKPGYDATITKNLNDPLWMANLESIRSWSYRLVAGADYGAADARRVQALSNFADGQGSVLIGQGALALPTTGTRYRSVIIPQYYQVIRTGTGDIDIAAGRDVQLLNPLATIYTAGLTASTMANFDLPVLVADSDTLSAFKTPYAPVYNAQYARSGGNVAIFAQNDIERLLNGAPDSVKEMPTNWLYRRGHVDANGYFSTLSGAPDGAPAAEIQSTSWWVDYSNFFDDVGALGGGNVVLTAGHDVENVNASVPTNARMPGRDAAGLPTIKPDVSQLVELGGGDLSVKAGRDINGGVYYTERGDTTLRAGQDVTSNGTRAVNSAAAADTLSPDWLPTTFFLGQGRVDVAAGRDLWLGPVANPFLCYQGVLNRNYETSYFSTFAPTDSVALSSFGGTVTLQAQPIGSLGTAGSLYNWYAGILTSATQPWTNLILQNNKNLYAGNQGSAVMTLLPGTLRAAAFVGDIDVIGALSLTPAARGTIDLLAAGNLNGVSVNYSSNSTLESNSAAINLSDASVLPGPATPQSLSTDTWTSSSVGSDASNILIALLAAISGSMNESGSTNLSLPEKLLLHDPNLLHAGDVDANGNTVPVHLYATGGDLSGLTLYSAKAARVVAAQDITDIALYVQNVRSSDVTLVTAGRDIITYDTNSALRRAATGMDINQVGPLGTFPTAGDIQIAGPGTLEVLAGRDLTLGSQSAGTVAPKDGTAAGITSVGAMRNPYLPLNSGASIVAVAGIRKSVTMVDGLVSAFEPGLAFADFGFASFMSDFLDPDSSSLSDNDRRYIDPVWRNVHPDKDHPLSEQQALAVLQAFYRVLDDTGNDYNNPYSDYYHTYQQGVAAIKRFLPDSILPGAIAAANVWQGNMSMPTKVIKTFEGGSISLLAPGGQIVVGRPTDPQTPDQGILTQYGGAVSIFALRNIDVGTSRIFTLRGGDETVWSTLGNIAAGSGSKTVYSAPPTRVLIDAQSADVKNDLGGLATGSGIGVLATLASVAPGNVNLIAPSGTVDAGDAGIRSSGHVNVSAAVIVNAANIQSSAGTSGTPVVAVANVSGLTTASTASAGASNSAGEAARQQQRAASQQQEDVLPSIIQVEVLGYGGGEGDETAQKKDEAGNG